MVCVNKLKAGFRHTIYDEYMKKRGVYMGFVSVGHCPKCGAPIYSPDVWMATTPPPVTFTCMCNPQAKIEIRTNTGD